MKVKQQPDDFQVTELTEVVSQPHGRFAFYRLEKQGWTTPDAVHAICRRWRFEPQMLSHGGLKDRHAVTVQYVSIDRGPRRGLKLQGVQLHYLGQLDEPYTSKQVQGNRFHLIVRDLQTDALPRLVAAVEEVRVGGVPNYFDDQRFGSVSPSGTFIAREMVLGRLEEALRLALTAPYQHDRTAVKREKALLRTQWGNWDDLKKRLPRGHARAHRASRASSR